MTTIPVPSTYDKPYNHLFCFSFIWFISNTVIYTTFEPTTPPPPSLIISEQKWQVYFDECFIPGKEILTIKEDDMSYICYEKRLISMQGETQLIISITVNSVIKWKRWHLIQWSISMKDRTPVSSKKRWLSIIGRIIFYWNINSVLLF